MYVDIYIIDAWVSAHVLSCVRPFATPWAIVLQAPLSKEFSRQEYWSGLPFPTPGDLPDPRIKPHLLHLLYWQENSLQPLIKTDFSPVSWKKKTTTCSNQLDNNWIIWILKIYSQKSQRNTQVPHQKRTWPICQKHLQTSTAFLRLSTFITLSASKGLRFEWPNNK